MAIPFLDTENKQMTLISRTAYPRFKKQFNRKEIRSFYHLTESDLGFVKSFARGNEQRLTLATLLKTFQHLGYFPDLKDIPISVPAFLCEQMKFHSELKYLNEENLRTSLYRYKESVRHHLHIQPFTSEEKHNIENFINSTAHTMSDPADLINATIVEFKTKNIELPAFSTLDRLVGNIRQKVHQELYTKITKSLHPMQRQLLEDLLTVQADEKFTRFSQLKKNPGVLTLKNIRNWVDHLHEIESIIDPKPFIQGITHTKVRQFAAEIEPLQAGDVLKIQNINKRHTLLLCFLHRVQNQVRDELVEMFLKRMKRTVNAAREKLKALQEENRSLEEKLIKTFGQILNAAGNEEKSTADFGDDVKKILQHEGGTQKLKQQYEMTSAYHQNNYLPLLWQIHAQYRSVLFRLLGPFKIKSSTQDQRLIKAFDYVEKTQFKRSGFLPLEIDLSFTSKSWQQFIITKKENTKMIDRRALEVCVLIHLADELECANLYIEGAENYGNPHTQFLSLEECNERLPEYSQKVGIPATGKAAVNVLKTRLSQAIEAADNHFPENSELTIDKNGTPHLKRQSKGQKPENLEAFQIEVRARMPERHLLDILKNANHWTEYTRHFGPPSGSISKMQHKVSLYLFTIFGNGCLLGDSQTARHTQGLIDRRVLQRINSQHINIEKLEAALTDLINEYKRFSLTGYWGKGQAAIADGTHMPLIENNLLGETHIRYGGYGGIAYHHISNNYIALFCNFISCGVWEGTYILDGLLKNASSIQPNTLHADTQGQSEPIFGLSYLLGIKLFTRMRNWNDATFYRPYKGAKYQHINTLFTEVIDWGVIETHWSDMMQVVLSIQAGKVLPSMLLRKLGSKNRKNKLYQAFRELGRVERTIFLMRYISDPSFRFNIRAETTKIESFHSFLDWIAFGGPLIKSGDPVEQAKHMKYMDIIANSVILQNVVDLTDVLNNMANEGFKITPELIASLSPYMCENILRFGKWTLDMEELPNQLHQKKIPITI